MKKSAGLFCNRRRTKMLAIERRNQILEKLQIDKKVIVGELSQMYDVSEETIRRDLEKLEKEGFAIKSYGGAVLNESNNIELPLNLRKKRNVVGKQKIAQLVKEMVSDKESLILDASSTSVFIAKELKEKKQLSIITNSIEIVMELFDTVDWNVLSTGGLAKEGTFALVGPQTDRMLKGYHVDKTIISCKGLDMKKGFSDSDDLHAANKKTMLESAVDKILVADHTKFNQTAFTQIAYFDDISKIVTDEKPDTEWLQLFEDMGVECIFPKE